jgi:serine/threonine protein kinase
VVDFIIISLALLCSYNSYFGYFFQCEGKYYDAKSDIWSLGCILYEMLCLQRTFEGTNLPALVHKIVEVSFEPVKGKYSDELKQVVISISYDN